MYSTISRLNSMHVSFLMFCFSVVCFFIYVSFRAAVSAFLSLSVQSTQFCFFTVLLYCICVDKVNIQKNIQYTGKTGTFDRS